MRPVDHLGKERRKYLRLDTVFPVRFRLESPDGKTTLSPWLQGFSSDVGKGGICLSVNNLKADNLKEINAGCRIALELDLPVFARAVKAYASSTWVKELSSDEGKYLFGLGYSFIDPGENNRIMNYAWGKKIFVPFTVTIVVLLAAGLIYGSYTNIKLEQGNRALVEKLVHITQESLAAKRRIESINIKRQILVGKISDLEKRIQETGAQMKNALEKEKIEKRETEKIQSDKTYRKITELDVFTKQLAKDKEALLEQLGVLKNREDIASSEFASLGKERAELEKENFVKMYKWLTIHQNKHSGLVMSFEGDGDVANWAFTYDQALAIQAFTYFGDFDRAKKVLNFFKVSPKSGRLVFNAYYANGGEPAEYIVHCGPNIWLGIAIVQYMHKTQDRSYLNLAEDIAAGIMALEDNEGGLRGGPGVEWYSTEHNLDAYAFFNMLYKVTGKQIYALTRDKILKWLIEHTYDTSAIPVKRGKGDATIATDTYAWSIAAVGPEKLVEVGMNPDKIMQFAEENCAVEVTYLRPEGRSIKTKGFDFAAKRNVARGGVVSSEWTAQMIISYKIMAAFHAKMGQNKQAEIYRAKADEYLLQLSKMIISSPSPSGQGESCLPYATQECVDTGHGWITPKGSSTGSLSGTVYTIFAYYNYNPLELER
ncbi:MAG: hypothetical protein ABSE81_05880 [Candidatus Omnitrophota bacterium]|jgi:hypothetical protein